MYDISNFISMEIKYNLKLRNLYVLNIPKSGPNVQSFDETQSVFPCFGDDIVISFGVAKTKITILK